MRISNSNPAPYDRDLAYIQDRAFSQFAEDATAHIIEKLNESAVPVVTVVDVGCGAGTSTRVLIEAGFRVVAIEPSASLLEIARTKAPCAEFLHATAYDAEIPCCDALIAVGEPLTYHDPCSDAVAGLQQFVSAAHSALSPGGMLVFDLIVSGRECLALKTWSAGEDWAILVHVTEDHDSSNLVREITTFRKLGETYRRRRELHSVHIFDEREIAGMLDESGFDVEVDSRYGSKELLPRRKAFFATHRT